MSRLSASVLYILRRPRFYVPIVAGRAVLAVYSRQPLCHELEYSELANALFIAVLVLHIAQFVVWWRAIAGQRLALGILATAGCLAWSIFGGVLLGGSTRGIETEHLVKDPELWRAYDAWTSYSVSPDGRWLIYARELPPGPEQPPGMDLRVVDLASRRVQTVEVEEGSLPPSYNDRSTPSERLARGLHAVQWIDDGALIGNTVIDPATGIARRAAVSAVAPRANAALAAEYASSTWRQRKPPNHKRGSPAVAWDGENVGLDVYVAGSMVWGVGREAGVLHRLRPNGRIEVVAERRELQADWGFKSPTVSPDGQLVAYEAVRRYTPRQLILSILTFPISAFAGVPSEDFVCVYDVEGDREYMIAKVGHCVSMRWSNDSRSLYFADYSLNAGIVRASIDLPAATSLSERTKLELPPPKKQPAVIDRYLEPAAAARIGVPKPVLHRTGRLPAGLRPPGYDPGFRTLPGDTTSGRREF